MTHEPQAAERSTSIIGDFFRGALMGAVETVPGVSGGTVALIVGIYTRLIDSASHIVSALRRLITRRDSRSAEGVHTGKIEWKLLISVFAGMVIALFTVAGPMADMVHNYPELTRAAFFGMVLASISIPLRMAGISGIRIQHLAAALLAAAIAFWLVSMPPTSLNPSPLVLIIAAAIAVTALLLPGLSGSFLLLTFGLYEPTLRAVDDRDFAYLGIFAFGLFLGVISIVKGLQWLLHHRRRITLVVLTGVMVGAMRTLWPWQNDSRDLLGPGTDWPAALALAIAGFIVVSVLSLVDARMQRRHIAALHAEAIESAN